MTAVECRTSASKEWAFVCPSCPEIAGEGAPTCSDCPHPPQAHRSPGPSAWVDSEVPSVPLPDRACSGQFPPGYHSVEAPPGRAPVPAPPWGTALPSSPPSLILSKFSPLCLCLGALPIPLGLCCLFHVFLSPFHLPPPRPQLPGSFQGVIQYLWSLEPGTGQGYSKCSANTGPLINRFITPHA